MDDNVPPYNTLLVVNELIKANKDFDLLLLPNRHHGFGNEPYMVRRRWDYFVRYLMGAEPPKEYELKAPPDPFAPPSAVSIVGCGSGIPTLAWCSRRLRARRPLLMATPARVETPNAAGTLSSSISPTALTRCSATSSSTCLPSDAGSNSARRKHHPSV